jgi:protein-tyrosine phosphatase
MFAITRCIWQGRFASPKRLADIRPASITDVLNVGESPNLLKPEDGPFAEITWLPVVDLQRIPDCLAIECLDALHRMVCVPGSRVYVHCVAGWNRSPTIIWLYLVACGLQTHLAKELIVARSLDAIPGHPVLVDTGLVETVRLHGAQYRPHPRPEALEPA